jgi:hypothetical protein
MPFDEERLARILLVRASKRDPVHRSEAGPALDGPRELLDFGKRLTQYYFIKRSDRRGGKTDPMLAL